MQQRVVVISWFLIIGGCTAAERTTPTECTVLPAIGIDDECEPEATQPSVCAWATSVDALVIAEVTAVELLTTPAEKATAIGEHVLVDDADCDEVVNPGLRLDIRVEQVLAGEAPTTLTVRIGADRVSSFDPLPFRGEDGSLTWSTGCGLQVGQRLGLPLHHVDEDDVWSLMGERLFSVDDDVVAFQTKAERCTGNVPVGGDGVALSTLIDDVSGCDDDADGAARRAEMLRRWGPTGASPSAYMAGQCTDPIPQ